MTFSGSIKSAFENSLNFRGRASRSEFWYWILFYGLVWLAALIVNGVLWDFFGDFWIVRIVDLALLLPFLALSVRRLHDVGWPGYLVGAFWVLPYAILLAYIVYMAGAALVLWNWNEVKTFEEFSRYLFKEFFILRIIGFIWAFSSTVLFFWQLVLFLLEGDPQDNAYGPPPEGSAVPVYQQGYIQPPVGQGPPPMQGGWLQDGYPAPPPDGLAGQTGGTRGYPPKPPGGSENK